MELEEETGLFEDPMYAWMFIGSKVGRRSCNLILATDEAMIAFGWM
jgi:hypothetical protein